METIAVACVRECVRQRVDLDSVAGLLFAYNHALRVEDNLPTERYMRAVAALVDPTLAGSYRVTPVTFDNGGSAVHWREVPDAMQRLFAHLDDETPAREFAKAFLDIHPYADGNGRVAFILYNWLYGTLRDPQPVPDFYG